MPLLSQMKQGYQRQHPIRMLGHDAVENNKGGSPN